MARTHTLASGQLGASSATLLAGSSAPPSNRVDIVLQNTGSNSETVVLTLQVAGATARRVCRAVLEENEQLFVIGLPIQPDDTLAASASNASAVDYTIFGSNGGGLRIEALRGDGVSKGVSTLQRILAGVEAYIGDELSDRV